MNEVGDQHLQTPAKDVIASSSTFSDYVKRVAQLTDDAAMKQVRDFSSQGLDSMLFSYFESQYETKFLSGVSSIRMGDSECSMCHRPVSAGDHFADIEFPGTTVWVTFCDECFANSGFSLSSQKAFLYRKVGTDTGAREVRWCLVGGFRYLSD